MPKSMSPLQLLLNFLSRQCSLFVENIRVLLAAFICLTIVAIAAYILLCSHFGPELQKSATGIIALVLGAALSYLFPRERVSGSVHARHPLRKRRKD